MAKLPEEKIFQVEQKEYENILAERYINTIGKLSRHYNSIEWWANPLSEKNEHVSGTYDHFYDYLESGGPSSNNKQGLELSGSKRFNILRNLGQEINRIKFSQTFLFFVGKLLIKKTITWFYFRKVKNLTDKEYILRTWLNDRVINASQHSYKDSYFGSLIPYLRERNKSFCIVAAIAGDYLRIVRHLSNFSELMILPEEYFLKFRDIFRLIKHLKLSKQTIKETLVDDRGIVKLLQNELNSGYKSAEYLFNLSKYYVAQTIAQTFRAPTYLYPFENYAWEKLTILGLNKNPMIRTKGFQHAFISRSSFKYFISQEEKEIVPLPEKIITLGKKTQEIMNKYGNYDQNIFSVGCALRQEYIEKIEPLPKSAHKKILVPLTMAIEESVAIFKFIYESELYHEGCEVIFRCHPFVPVEALKHKIPFDLPPYFKFSECEDVLSEIRLIDFVLYTWTTVAIEALKMGKPVIYMDILSRKYVDPLFECLHLKRIASEPKALRLAVRNLYSMKESDFYAEQELAQAYLKDYFFPVTRDNMEVFL